MATIRASRWLGWVLLGLSVLLSAGAIVLTALDPPEDVTSKVVVTLILAVPYPLAGAMIAGHAPRNAVGWIFSAVGLFQAINIFAESYGHYALLAAPSTAAPSTAAPGAAWPFGGAAIWIEQWTWIPSIGLLSTFLLLLFPNGRLASPRWRWAAWVSGIGVALLVVGAAAAAWPQRGLETLCAQYNNEANKAALLRACPPGQINEPQGQAPPFFYGIIGMVGAGALGSAASLVQRFRRSQGVERQQLKWIALAGVVVFIGVVLLFTPHDQPAAVLFLSLPIAVTMAILRYHLWDIDLIIRRTLVYGSLVTCLALIYFASVVLFQFLFRIISGANSPAAIVLSTLVIAGLFNQLAARIRRLIDKRFYRQQYNAEQILAAFSARLRSEVDLEQLNEQLQAAVQEALQPEKTEIWLMGNEKGEVRSNG